MKKFLVALFIIATVCSFSLAFAGRFSDVPDNMWAAEQIGRWADEGVVMGYEDGTYRPSNFITRAEFATMIVKMFEPIKVADLAKYKDVSKDDWFYENLAKAVAMGSIEEDTSSSMRPNAYVTRQEAVVILNSVLKYAPAYKDAIKDFGDYDEIADYAEEDVEVFAERDYVVGYPDGTFRPADTITRAEAATILDRIFKLIINVKGEFDCTGIGVNNVIIVKADNVTLKNADQVGRIIFLNDTVKKNCKGITEDARKNSIVINPGSGSDSKTTSRTSSSGGSSSGSSTSKIATFTVKKTGNKFALTRNGVAAQNGRRLKIVVDGKTVVNEIINEKTDLLGLLEDVANAMNNVDGTARIINTLDEKRFGFEADVEDWGTATIAQMAIDGTLKVKDDEALAGNDAKSYLKADQGNAHNYDIGDVYDALTEEAQDTVFDTAMKVLKDEGLTNAQILTALNNLPK
ncbi:MAG: S-layer homology domain-containing protein [Clostridia bacterium]|nr:S-layer homology domain-containing protein [Clostridia bacterium]